MSLMTDTILRDSELSYIPRMAMVVYATKKNSYYIESHEIDEKGRLGAGAPLSLECITDMVSTFSQEHAVTPSGKIPANMLYADNRIGFQKYIWYNPPEKRMMFFAKALNIPDREYHVPGIVYVVSGDKLNLYAFKGNKPKDKLYKAPFFNTTNGSVCLGTANIGFPKNPTFDQVTGYWEKRFWLTEFTHLGGSQNPTKHNLVTVTKNSTEGFDYNELIEINVTLKNLLK